MRGLLADVNVQGHLRHLRNLLVALDLWDVLAGRGLALATSPELGLARDLDDRSLWAYCQRERWVLFTENRNHEDGDSLGATIADSWRAGHLSVLTPSDKGRFEHDRAYADRVACDVADLMFGIAEREYLDQPRIYIPRGEGRPGRTAARGRGRWWVLEVGTRRPARSPADSPAGLDRLPPLPCTR